MFFGTSTSYWLASRCISFLTNNASFKLRIVNNNGLDGSSLYDLLELVSGAGIRVCPVVYLPSSVEVTVSTDASTYHKTVPHEVQ